MNKIILSFYLFLAAAPAYAGLFEIQSTYFDVNIQKSTVITGKGFSISTTDSQGKARYFIATAAHVAQGSDLKILSSEKQPCSSLGELTNNNSDLKIIEVGNCFTTPHFVYEKGQRFVGSSETKEFLIANRDNSSAQISLTKNGDPLPPAQSAWYNMTGDLVTNIMVSPGQSGSPIVEVQGNGQYVLKGIIKGRWRFFGLSKAISASELIHATEKYLSGTRGYLGLTYHWAVRNNVLTQEIDPNHRDLSFQSNPSGNGISVDTGDPIGPLNWTPKNEALRDFTLQQNSQLPIGMIYGGEHITGFRVKLKCPKYLGDEILVYSSMANLIYLNKNSQDFEINRKIYFNTSLAPYRAQRYFGFENSFRIAHNILDFNPKSFSEPSPPRPLKTPLPLMQESATDGWKRSDLPKNLLQIKKNTSEIWGRDTRNTIFLDFEELEKASADPCDQISEEWKKVFVKQFKTNLDSGQTSVSVNEFKIKE